MLLLLLWLLWAGARAQEACGAAARPAGEACGGAGAARGFTCECNSTSRVFYNGTSLSCEPCRPNEVLSSDRSACVPRRCVEKEKGRSSCLVCGRNQISVTQNVDGSPLKEVKCVTCKQGYQPSADKSTCRPCSLISSSKINVCACDNKAENLIRGVCIPKSYVQKREEYKPKGNKMWDHNMFSEMLKSEYLCTNGNTSACEGLANLCVLSFYDTDLNGPCHLWLKTNSRTELPSITYGENEAYSVLNQKTVPASYRFTGDAQNSEIKLAMAVYSKNGLSVRYTQVVSDWSSLCPCGKNMPDVSFKLGYNYRIIFARGQIFETVHSDCLVVKLVTHLLMLSKVVLVRVSIKQSFLALLSIRHKCKLTAQELLSQDRPGIVAPFLLYTNSTNKTCERLNPIAVAIKIDNGDFIKNSDNTNLKLFRRFFLLHKWTESERNTSERRGVAGWYLRSATLKIKIEYGSHDHTNKIYTPLLMLEYAAVKMSDVSSTSQITLTFALVNEIGGNNFIHSMEITVGVLAGVGILYSLLQTWGLGRRSACSPAVGTFYFFMLLCGNISNLLYLVSFSASLHSLIMFQWQNVVYTLPPTRKEELFLEAFVISAFALKLVEVAWLNWKQCRMDIFLLDWLTPHLNTGSIHYEAEKDSVWRKLVVAKHWCSIQTERIVSVPALILITLFILECLHLSDTYLLEHHSYRYGSSAAIFACTYTCLFALAYVRNRRYSRVAELMRVCAEANISVFVFEEELYAHYVHGRYVETSESGGERVTLQGKGLLPNHPHQAFSICCDINFRIIYKKLSEGFMSTGLPMGTIMKNDALSTANLTQKAESLETIEDFGSRMFRDPNKHSQALLTKFLASFIDQALEGTSWVVRERTIIERLFNIEFGGRGSYPGLSTMLRDTQPDTHSYSSVLWHGGEWSLATFDLFFFSFTEWLAGGHLLAGFVVIGTWKVMEILRHEAGKRNFLKKTNMDANFIH